MGIGLREKRRQKALLKVAREIGYEYFSHEGVLPAGLSTSLRSYFFDEYRRNGMAIPGSSRLARGLIGKSSGHEIAILDYEYDCWGNSEFPETTVRQTLACFCLPHTLPNFKMRPRRLFEKSDFPGVEAFTQAKFSKNYLLQSAESGASQFLSQGDIANFFSAHKGWWVEVGRGWLIVYRAKRTVSARRLPTFVNEVERIFTLFAAPSGARDYLQFRLDCQRRAITTAEKAFGPEHPTVATALVQCAALLRELGQEKEASEMEARAQAIRAKHVQENPAR